eukprot:CAMPEP_0172556674 /NCGR_PEP_ID=MMETSP1067-20121228/68147_1 /TAXON_ID=265564 ORGANISM="Thalassiosira punctigera, Strain Tpunct2005C2" /NCGR_SAMPLE_ID=MMETSP1067 /ASSEMBLY_ACC=CAM_ASM_000444 /LENGTH=48 /DNA_ID= /DNA_START= /DNA_END= /DNA_ORIENTATION=
MTLAAKLPFPKTTNYLLVMMGASAMGEIDSRRQKLKQKMALLPRLAET